MKAGIRGCVSVVMLVLSACSGGPGARDVAPETEAVVDAEADQTISPVVFPYCEVDEEQVQAIYSSMTVRQRIGQHLMVQLFPFGDGIAAESLEKLEDFEMGNAFVGPPSGIYMDEPDKTALFVHNVKKEIFERTGVPAFVALDQEGGPNAAVNSVTGATDTIGSMPIGATGDPQVAREQFDIMGREVALMGFNMDFGPVLDTLESTANGNLNTRPFSPDPDLNSALGAAAVAGLQQNLILAVGKHFPGDGLTPFNTHKTHALVEDSLEKLEATVFKPFKSAIDAGCDGIMTIPAAYSALDPDRCAITSRYINTQLLRQQMGFEGLIVTDSLGMKGATYGLEEGQIPGVEALRAGADILLHVTWSYDDLETAVATVEAELAAGTLSAEEFEESTKLILRYKQRYCLWQTATSPDEGARALLADRLATLEDRKLSRSHADRAVVLLEDNGILPLTGKKLLYIGPDTMFQDPGSGWLNLLDQTPGDALAAYGAQVEQVRYFMPFGAAGQYALVKEKAPDADVVVMGTLQGWFDLSQQQLLEWVLEDLDKPVVHVILGVPFDYAQSRVRADAVLALMGSRSVMVEAGAAVLLGKQPAQGTMRFDLNKVHFTTNMDGPGQPPGTDEDRCVEQDIKCSDGGVCVDIGTDYGCVCHPNYHPAPDGLDCLPDG